MREILPLLVALATVVVTGVIATVVPSGTPMAYVLPIATGLVVYIVVAIFVSRKSQRDHDDNSGGAQ